MSPNSCAASHTRCTFRFLSAAAAVTLLTAAVSAAPLPVHRPPTVDGQVKASGLLATLSKLKEVDVTSLVPAWQPWWFFTSMTFCAALLAFGFHRLRVRHLVRIERMRTRIAAEIHHSAADHLSRIATLSDRVLRQAESALPQAMPSLVSIANDARKVIDELSDAIWFVDPKLDNLHQVIIRVRAVASDLFDARQIVWTLDAPANTSSITLAPEQRRHVYLILKETLTNVLRHAGATRVALHVSASRRRLVAEIEDNGIGHDLSSVKSNEGGGRFTNLHAHASALGGIVTISARDQDGGTRLVVEAPIG